MPKKRMIFSIALMLCVAFLTTAWDWNFDDLAPKKETVTEEPAPEPVEDLVAEPPAATFTCGDIISDSDGLDYATVQIGEQCWMAKSLNVGGDMNGPDEMTNDGKIQKYCFQNDPANCDAAGGLYTWTEAMGYTDEEGAQGICPDGWHIPLDGEWHVLEAALAEGPCDLDRRDYGCDPAGQKLRSGGNSGFNGVVMGIRTPGGDFVGGETSFWSSTRLGDQPLGHTISSDSRFRRLDDGPNYGFSVRCIKN